MFKRGTMLAVLLLASATHAAWAADPVGTYSVEGKNPDTGSGYTGSVVVTQTGETYKIVWSVGGETYVGTAIGNEKFMAVSYKSGGDTGLALYSEKGSDWDGIWTYAGGRRVGTEVWTRE